MSLAETAATVPSRLPLDATLGLGTMLHWVPSQCSMRVRDTLLLASLEELPTAQASPDEIATTPLSWFDTNFVLGLGTILQLVPFQCSMSVRDELPSLRGEE